VKATIMRYILINSILAAAVGWVLNGLGAQASDLDFWVVVGATIGFHLNGLVAGARVSGDERSRGEL
jgi:hypothetical protein